MLFTAFLMCFACVLNSGNRVGCVINTLSGVPPPVVPSPSASVAQTEGRPDGDGMKGGGLLIVLELEAEGVKGFMRSRLVMGCVGGWRSIYCMVSVVLASQPRRRQ